MFMKREEIFQVAKEIFLKKGYSGMNMREIAKLSGVSIGTLYNLFGSKENLSLMIMRENLNKFLKDLETRVSNCRSDEEKVKIILAAVREFLILHEKSFKEIMISLIAKRERPFRSFKKRDILNKIVKTMFNIEDDYLSQFIGEIIVLQARKDPSTDEKFYKFFNKLIEEEV